jgi:hypothetical protein
VRVGAGGRLVWLRCMVGGVCFGVGGGGGGSLGGAERGETVALVQDGKVWWIDRGVVFMCSACFRLGGMVGTEYDHFIRFIGSM